MHRAVIGDRHEIAGRLADRKTLIHPELGGIEVELGGIGVGCQALSTEDRPQALLVLTPRRAPRLREAATSRRPGRRALRRRGTG